MSVLPPEPVPQHEHDTEKEITAAIAAALGERKLRLTDRRLLVLYVLTVAILSLFLWREHVQQDQHDQDRRAFEQVELANCHTLDSIITNSNGYFERQANTTLRRTDLSPASKQELVDNFTKAHLPNLHCVVGGSP